MYLQILSRKEGYATQKLFELEKPIRGYDKVIVSCKPNGANGLKGSYFIWGTTDGVNNEKELDWDMDDTNFVHEEVLENLINKNK